MNVFEVIADPVRRRLIELLADGERRAGDLVEVIRTEFGISQPAVSNALRVLRESGVVADERRGTSRVYRLEVASLAPAAQWLERYGGFWEQRLDALDTELARGRRDRSSNVAERYRPSTDRHAG